MAGLSAAVAIRSVSIREESHRRATLIAIAVLLIFSTAPVIGHHFSAGLGLPLARLDHLGAFCVVALRSMLTPVHGLFHLALWSGLAYALWDRWSAWRHQLQTLSPLDATAPQPGEPFFLLAAGAGLDPARLRIVKGLPNPAFTVGLASPRSPSCGRLSISCVHAILDPGASQAFGRHGRRGRDSGR